METMMIEQNPEDQSFATRREVFRWLKDQETWQIGERTLYKHCREGKLRPRRDGRYSLRAVKRYARTWLPELATGLKAADQLEALQETKLREEIELKRAQRAKLDFQRLQAEGKYFPTADLEMEIAARAAALITRIEYTITTRAADWLRTVAPESAADSEALAALVWEDLTDALSDYADTRNYQVVARPGAGDDELDPGAELNPNPGPGPESEEEDENQD